MSFDENFDLTDRRSVFLDVLNLRGGFAGGGVWAAVEANARRQQKQIYQKAGLRCQDFEGCLSRAREMRDYPGRIGD